jgi:hypothetical protein
MPIFFKGLFGNEPFLEILDYEFLNSPSEYFAVFQIKLRFKGAHNVGESRRHCDRKTTQVRSVVRILFWLVVFELYAGSTTSGETPFMVLVRNGRINYTPTASCATVILGLTVDLDPLV